MRVIVEASQPKMNDLEFDKNDQNEPNHFCARTVVVHLLPPICTSSMFLN